MVEEATLPFTLEPEKHRMSYRNIFKKKNQKQDVAHCEWSLWGEIASVLVAVAFFFKTSHKPVYSKIETKSKPVSPQIE